MKKLGYIDALRGFAILAVVMVHCIGVDSNNFSPMIESILGNGGRGVQLFFIISAFTLFLSMSNRNTTEKKPLSNFFIRRFFRIAPMFYLAIVYFTIERFCYGTLAMEYIPELSIASIASSFTFLHGLSPYWINNVVPGGWTIAAEMIFYCFMPFLFRKVKNMNHAFILFFVAIFLQHIIIFAVKQIPFGDPILMRTFLYYFLPNNLPVFVCGIFLYHLIYTQKQDWRINPLLLMLFGACLLFQIAIGKLFFSLHIQFAMVFVIIIYALSQREVLLLVNPITRFIGKISFSMYLVHFAVLHQMTRLNLLDLASFDIKYGNILNLGARYIIVLLVSVIISFICYHLIEVPFQNMGRRLIKKREEHIESMR